MLLHSKSLEETRAAASNLLQLVEAVVKANRTKLVATVVALQGDLGSGKTTFAQQLGLLLGVRETIASPTYVIEKIYKIPGNPSYKHFIHIDAYRLESDQEMLKLGWQEIVFDPHNIIVIEWPERISRLLPQDYIDVKFEFVDENTRRIEMNYVDRSTSSRSDTSDENYASGETSQ